MRIADHSEKTMAMLIILAGRHKRVELRRASYSQGGSIAFHGADGGAPDFSEASRFVGLTLGAPRGGLYIAFNSSHQPLVAALPDWPGRTWVPLIDTGKVGELPCSRLWGRPWTSLC